MKVTIIGTGNMGKGIGARLLHGGHQVTLHTRDLAKTAELVGLLAPHCEGAGSVSVTDFGATVDDVVILAVPFTEIPTLVTRYDNFAGKVVVDITNPVDFKTFSLIPPPGVSGAETIAAIIPEARVIKAFNTVFAGTLLTGEVDGKMLDVFVAGEDAEAKETVQQLVRDGGMRPVDVGSLSNAHHLEGFQLLVMAAQGQLATNWMSALKILG